MALTVAYIKSANPGRHSDGRGLSLLVKPSGSKSWTLRVQREGRRRDYGLGSFPNLSLAKAREKAGEWRQRIQKGIDPRAARKSPEAGSEVETDWSLFPMLPAKLKTARGARLALLFGLTCLREN